MELSFKPGAEQDLRELSESHRIYILNRLEELEQNPTSHSDSAVIEIDGTQVFRYRMKEDDTRGGKDYRAVYDIEDLKIRVIAIFHRDEGYNSGGLPDRI